MIISSIHQLKYQDYYAQASGDDWETVVLADGISATHEADWAAKFAVKTLIDQLKSADGSVSATFFQEVFSQLPELMRQQLPIDFLPIPTLNQIEHGFGTTLLCGIRHKETYWFSYVGNGGIIHLRSRWLHQTEYQYPVPWSAINLLNPHTIEQEGQERLYRYISPSSEQEYQRAVPTVFCLTETPDPGDYFILCTDGIFSSDHLPFSNDDEGGVWLRYEKRLTILFELLRRKPRPDKNDLDTYLQSLNVSGQLDDDATISIMWHV